MIATLDFNFGLHRQTAALVKSDCILIARIVFVDGTGLLVEGL
jgi:hypothetical protein